MERRSGNILVLVCALTTLVIGCAAPGGDGDLSPSSIGELDGLYSRSGVPRSTIVFSTPELRELQAERQIPGSFGPGDWEYGRNNRHLGNLDRPSTTQISVYEITEYESRRETNGRPRVTGRWITRSLRTGVGPN